MTEAESLRADVAAYLLDRADSYNLDSPCWVALSDAAEAVACGDAEKAAARGEFDDELRGRVEQLRRTGLVVR